MDINNKFLGKHNNRPPMCTMCGGEHLPEYPHEFSITFRNNFSSKNNILPTVEDTYSHCEGLMLSAVKAAHLSNYISENKAGSRHE